ncbi:MAG: hypothetical protein AB7E29_11035 [Xanthobacter sp.]
MKAKTIAVLGLIGLGLGACVTAAQQTGNMLSAAGFSMRQASTPQQQAQLQKFPANKFFVQSKNGEPRFFYADPQGCNCVYYGTQANYQAYQQMRFQQNMANEEQMTAMMNQQTAFDMGPWGPGPYGPFW